MVTGKPISLIGAILALSLSWALASQGLRQDTCRSVPNAEKLNCLPEKNSVTENDCQSRQCCWIPSDDPIIPSCFYGQSYPGYTVSDLVKTTNGLKATLQRQGASGFPKEVQQLAMDVEYLHKSILRVKIYDKNSTRFEPSVPQREELQFEGPPDYSISISNGSAGFRVTRKDNGEEIFDTDISGFIFSDQFIQISSVLPSKYIYGLGEHNERLLLNTTWKTYTLFNRGEQVRKQSPQNHTQFNLYGSHAFYLSIEKNGKANGVFLLNSNAMDIVLQPKPTITYRTIGGILDFYFFMGPTPDDVISQYTSIVGKPTFPPYWSLGFHLSRYNYGSANRTREVWQRNVDAGIPFDTQWSDIDYMNDHKIFTYDPVNYKELRPLIDDIHNAGMHWVPITNPGLSGMEGSGNYPPFDQAKALDILIKDNSGEVLTAKVWQNVTVFVDFSNPKAADYWKAQYQEFHNKLPYDGSWIDMNEPYSFESGSLKGCPANSSLEYPPYVPGNETLFHGTICLSSQQFLSTHYDLHNLYSLMQAIDTYRALQDIIQKRPFILSRSNFAGYGRYGAHWTGDIRSEWSYLKDSVPNILNFNLFAIPMIGADICGFIGNVSEELCTRWSQLGAFYPFARNHNDYDTLDQDPVAFGKNMVDRVTKVMETRYHLLPYLYTLFYHSHMLGTPVLRPLFFDNLDDEKTYNIDTHFLWGKALMILPILESGATKVNAYIPKGNWYSYHTGQKIESHGQDIEFDAPIDTINLLIKEGNILPLQEPARTTQESRKNPFQLVVALNSQATATGNMFWDDGDSINSIQSGNFNYVQFTANKTALVTIPEKNNYTELMELSKITYYGLPQAPKNVMVNNRIISNFTYNSQLMKTEIFLEDTTLNQPNTITMTLQREISSSSSGGQNIKKIGSGARALQILALTFLLFFKCKIKPYM